MKTDHFISDHYRISLVIKNNRTNRKAEGRISKRMSKKTKHAKFAEKKKISHSLIRTRTCAQQGVNIHFFGKFGVLFFLVTRVLRFALLPYYRRNTF